MERPVLDIPGYYYDKDKNKYFKIQNSSAAPSSSAYSAKDVKRRKICDDIANAQALETARQNGRIKRSKVLEEPLIGGFLERSQARKSPWERLDSARIVASGLISQGCLSSLLRFSDCSDPFFDIDHRTDLGGSIVDVRIVFDDQLFTVRINSDRHTRTTQHGSIEICHDFSIPTVNKWRLERFGHPGASTSLSTHQQSKRLAVTWLSGSPQSGIAIAPMAGIPTDREFVVARLSESAIAERCPLAHRDAIMNPARSSRLRGQGARATVLDRMLIGLSIVERPTILLGPGVTRGADISVYSSAPAPPNTSLLFAFGSSHGIFTVDKRDFDTTWLGPILSGSFQKHPKDIFALEFLSDNPFILLSGGRSGILHIIDLRLPKYNDIINHPSSITHIKQLDSNRLIVAGLNSNLCQYDLRFRKTDTSSSTSPSPRTKQRLISFCNFTPTRSILSYEEYHNDASIQLGFDVDLESGIVAAAQEADERYSTVQLFSLHGGHKLDSEISKYGGCDDEKRVKCLKFARDVEGRVKSLYMGTRPGIQRYAWADREDGDLI